MPMSGLGRRRLPSYYVEGTSSAWEADVLPLNYTRKMLGFRRFYSQTVYRITVGGRGNVLVAIASARSGQASTPISLSLKNLFNVDPKSKVPATQAPVTTRVSMPTVRFIVVQHWRTALKISQALVCFFLRHLVEERIHQCL